MMLRLTERLRDLGRDPDVRVVAIQSRGDDFCRGRDGRGEAQEPMSAYEMRSKMMGVILGVYSAIAEVPVPVVSCVQGRAIGFGSALAGGCDITLASDKARFSFPEIEHNIPPTLAMAAVMRSVPYKALTYLIYSGEEIDATTAITFGLASRIYPAASFERDVAGFLAKLAGRPRVTLETIKRFQAKTATLGADMVSEYAGTLLALVRSA